MNYIKLFMRSKTRCLFFLFLSLNLLTFSAFSQDASGTIKGTLLDSVSQKPLEFITLALKKEGSVVKTLLSTAHGTFIFEKIPFGEYTLSIVAIGFTAKNIPLKLSADQPYFDAGKLHLDAQANTLSDVSISVSRPLIKQEVDRISYDIQADPESKVLTALDMMRKVPLLSLDADDNIKLKGSGNYKILINGKPSSMIARNPKDVLQSMPASSIQKIEVITTPPSKYDSEGLAGIINIITNKKIDNGYNGNLNLRHQFPVGGPNIGGSVTLKQGKFGITGYGGTGIYGSPSTEIIYNRITTGAEPSELLNTGWRKFKNNHRYGGMDVSYEIDSLNLITVELNPYSGYNKLTKVQEFKLTSPAQITAYSLLSNNRFNWDGFNASFNYQLGFKNIKDRLLTFSYAYNDGGNPQLNDLFFSNRQNYTVPDYKQQNEGRTKEQTLQLDYVHPIKELRIEGGVKSIFRNNTSNFEYMGLNANNGNYEIDPTRTNTFTNNQNILGVYNSYSYTLTNWGFKGGLRLEETFVKADFISNASQINTHYFNLIPTFSINRKFKNETSLNFGFTQRIERPGIDNINPFIDRSTPNYESTGNPDLKAVLSNNFELTYSRFKKGSINLGLSYNYSNNAVQRIVKYSDIDKISRSSYANIGKNKALTSNLNVTYPLNTKWNLSINGNIGYTWIEGYIDGKSAKNDGFTGYIYLNTGYKFNHGWRATTTFSYNAAEVMLQGKSGQYSYMSFSGSKELIKDRLTFSASINNPFTKYRYYRTFVQGDNFSQNYSGQNFNRSVNMSLNWKFGKLSNSIKKNQRNINNDDVKSGSKSGN